ncbi:MAG TPA: hypothetical protein VHN13_05405, partial [Candidatus Tectomicrobia bacterium]|nr:hypothetical protein [Candidatus Tectomicrobia bacterium]
MRRRTQRRAPFLLGVVTVLISLGTAWGDSLLAQRSQPTVSPARESRWGSGEPLSERRPQPSLLGTTGYFDLPTSESLRQGHFAIGLFPMFEKVFTADIGAGDDFTRLRLDRYSATLSGAYGIMDNLELGVAVRGVNTAAEFKQFMGGDVSSGDVHKTGLGKIRVGLKYRPASLDFARLGTIGFAGLTLEPFVDIDTHGSERGFSYPYRDQDTVYGINLLMGGQAGPVGIHWRFGYSRTDGSNVDNFAVLGSPFRIGGPGLSDGERIS